MNEGKSEQTAMAFNYIEPPEGAEEYYANHLQVFWTGVDVTLVFGELTHSPEKVAQHILEIENRAKVTFSWSVAKLVMNNLAGLIARYEEKNGEVKLPGQYELP
jgi:uncharacterized protein DUF3467